MEHWFTVQNWEKRPFVPQVVIIFLQPPSPGLVFKFQKTGFLAASRNHVKSHIEVGANTSLTIDQIEIDLDVRAGAIGDQWEYLIIPYYIPLHPIDHGGSMGKKKGIYPQFVWPYMVPMVPDPLIPGPFRGWTSSKNVFFVFSTPWCVDMGITSPLESFWNCFGNFVVFPWIVFWMSSSVIFSCSLQQFGAGSCHFNSIAQKKRVRTSHFLWCLQHFGAQTFHATW